MLYLLFMLRMQTLQLLKTKQTASFY